MKKDGPNVDIETYSFLTTTPNPLVATINHERMPVLLTREEEFQTWLTGTPDEAFALAREYPAERMGIVQEGWEDLGVGRARCPPAVRGSPDQGEMAAAVLYKLNP